VEVKVKLIDLPIDNNLYWTDVYRQVSGTLYQTLGSTDRYCPERDGTIEFRERFQVRLTCHLPPLRQRESRLLAFTAASCATDKQTPALTSPMNVFWVDYHLKLVSQGAHLPPQLSRDFATPQTDST
jgi:hypothetical protein